MRAHGQIINFNRRYNLYCPSNTLADNTGSTRKDCKVGIWCRRELNFFEKRNLKENFKEEMWAYIWTTPHLHQVFSYKRVNNCVIQLTQLFVNCWGKFYKLQFSIQANDERIIGKSKICWKTLHLIMTLIFYKHNNSNFN